MTDTQPAGTTQPVGHGRVGWQDAARRREWAAAWRAAASLLAAIELPASTRTAHIVTEVAQEFVAELQDRAEEVEAGTRTPWADQPEPAPAPDEPAGRRLMDVGEFRRLGYLQEANRQFFHPLGLALAVTVDPDGTERLNGVWDDRDDPEGIRYAPGVIDPEKTARVLDAQRRMGDSRLAVLGYVMQPAQNHTPLSKDAHDGVFELRWALAAGPHPDTPDRPGVLGRALLHQTVDGHPQLWAERDGLWHTHIASEPRTRGYVESAERYVGPVREVLMVSPAAGRVLDAARHVAALDSLGDYQDWRRVAALHHNLRDAVDALDERDAARAELAEVIAERDQQHAAYQRHLDHVSAQRDRAETELAEVTAQRNRLRERLADSIDPAAIPDQRAKGWTDWHPEAYCHRCGRPNIWSWHADSAVWNEVHGGSGPIWCPVCFTAEHERVTGRRMTWRLAPTSDSGQVGHLIRSEAAMRHQLAEVRAELAIARRDAAADALEEAANDASVLLESGDRAFTARGLRTRAEIIRAGERPVPGSPQPAEGGDDDG